MLKTRANRTVPWPGNSMTDAAAHVAAATVALALHLGPLGSALGVRIKYSFGKGSRGTLRLGPLMSGMPRSNVVTQPYGSGV